jgi:MFS family permease
LSFHRGDRLDEAAAMGPAIILLSVFAATVGNATVFATLGLFGRGIGLSELEVGAIFASSALLFFLTSSHWGRLSDTVGRKPVIVAGLAGTAVSLFLFAGLYQANWPGALIGLLAARAIYGLVAGGIQPAAIATMADTTTGEKRAAGVGLVGAAVGIGSIGGPILTATLISFGLSVPVAAAGVIIALVAVATVFGVRDGHRRPVAAPVAASPADGLRSHLLLAFAMVLGFSALQPTTAFYVQDRFHLDTAVAIRETSLASASFAACSFVMQVLVVRALALRPRELLRIGLAICLLGIGGGILAPASGWLIAAFGVLGIGYGLAQSGLMAAASIVGGEHRQGQVAGHLQAVMSAAWIVGALGGTTLYAFSIGAPLMLAAAGMAFALFHIRR